MHERSAIATNMSVAAVGAPDCDRAEHRDERALERAVALVRDDGVEIDVGDPELASRARYA